MEKYFCSECSYSYDPANGEEEYDIEIGTNFEDIDENTWSCPSCGAPKEAFLLPNMEIQEAYDSENLLDIEELHIPKFSFVDGNIVVRIGNDDMIHPTGDDHKIEWIGLFDEDGEVVEVQYSPDVSEAIIFTSYTEDDFSHVRAKCSVHGIWRSPRVM